MHIRELARRFGLSRSTLLYYDRVGLLKASGRKPNGYRFYTEKDSARLAQIVLYRKTGLAVAEIQKLLQSPGAELASALEQQLYALSEQIEALRERQRVIVGLLQKRDLLDKVNILDRETWVRLLQASGFTEKDMQKWHRDFEQMDPERHQRFLEFLGISHEQIDQIRGWSRALAEALTEVR